MEQELMELKERVIERKKRWEDAKEPQHVVSIFVCNRRIKKLMDAMELIAELEEIEEYTK